MRRQISLAIGFLLASQAVYAQQPRAPRGAQTYQVIGYYEGEAMEPWLAQRIVRDTTIDEKPWLAITYQARLAADGWRYSYTALLSEREVKARWVGNGRVRSTCDAARDQDRIVAKMGEHGSATSPTLTRDVVPDFALASILAERALADNDSIKLHVFRCNPGSPSPVFVQDLNAVVTTGTFPRKENGPPEPVWVVTGDRGFPYVVQIAKSDRQVLKVTMPQGTVGEMSETYTASKDPM